MKPGKRQLIASIFNFFSLFSFLSEHKRLEKTLMEIFSINFFSLNFAFIGYCFLFVFETHSAQRHDNKIIYERVKQQGNIIGLKNNWLHSRVFSWIWHFSQKNLLASAWCNPRNCIKQTRSPTSKISKKIEIRKISDWISNLFFHSSTEAQVLWSASKKILYGSRAHNRNIFNGLHLQSSLECNYFRSCLLSQFSNKRPSVNFHSAFNKVI